MNNEPKFCVNCRWYARFQGVGPFDIAVATICQRPRPDYFDLVSGEQHKAPIVVCSNERKEDMPCGPDAKLWEEKV